MIMIRKRDGYVGQAVDRLRVSNLPEGALNLNALFLIP
jgi:hypothetical protein